MNQSHNAGDQSLGMDRVISRRDFLDGVAQGVGGLAAASMAGGVSAQNSVSPSEPSARAGPATPDSPPCRQGKRGFYVASMEAGHAVRDGQAVDEAVDTGEHYDLLIVGAGMSGLSAAYFYQQQRPGAKFLILEDCDDFGGHARRVEFQVD